MWTPTRPQAPPLAASAGQTEMPFIGLHYPAGVAVDTKGSVYVADRMNNRVLKLAAGSSAQEVLPFTDLDGPLAVAVDREGTVYVSDCNKNRVWKLPAGSNTPIVLIDDHVFFRIEGLAVDSAGNLYGTAMGVYPTRDSKAFIHHGQVWKMTAPTAPDANRTELPFTGLTVPNEVAVDNNGNVYVADNPRMPDGMVTAGNPALGSHRVLELPVNSTTQTILPFTTFPPGPDDPTSMYYGVAVDNAGTIYVATYRNLGDAYHPNYVDNQTLKLVAGSSTPTVLAFAGLNVPQGVAVRPPWMTGAADSVYVADSGNNRVLKLGLG
jgi:serine/threonine-protein kinase